MEAEYDYHGILNLAPGWVRAQKIRHMTEAQLVAISADGKTTKMENFDEFMIREFGRKVWGTWEQGEQCYHMNFENDDEATMWKLMYL